MGNEILEEFALVAGLTLVGKGPEDGEARVAPQSE